MSASRLLSSRSDDDLLTAAAAGDQTSLALLMEHHRSRLEQIVELRMDPKVRGRVDSADVVQETYLSVLHRAPAFFKEKRRYPFFLWLRMETLQKLVDVHRFHLGAKMRSAYGEISLHGNSPTVSSASMAGQLIGKLSTGSVVAIRAEVRQMIEDLLNQLTADDREVLLLRHFEELSNSETADVLGISPTAACNRHVRALKRLKGLFRTLPDGADGLWP